MLNFKINIIEKNKISNFKDAFTAFHVDINKVNKYLKGLEIGRLSPNTNAIQNASPDDVFI